MDGTLEVLLKQAWQLYDRCAQKPYLVRPSLPILYFGDRRRYFDSPLRIVTVGLNPSRFEFPEASPFRRFPIASVALAKGRVASEPHIEALDSYFRTDPYAKWFNPAFEAMLNGLDCSYYDEKPNTALHTDLCSPLATNPTWSKLAPAQRSGLEPDGLRMWLALVEYLQPDVILISVAKRYLSRLPLPVVGPWHPVHTLPRTKPYVIEGATVQLESGKRSQIIFGRAAQLPFGTVSKEDKLKIGVAVRAHSPAQG